MKKRIEGRGIAVPLLFGVLSFLIPVGCGRSAEPDSAAVRNTLKVFVTIEPMEYFAERIGGDAVNAETLVPAGSDPHTFEPTSQVMVSLASADIYFTVGLELEEAFLGTLEASLPDLVVVNTSEGLEAIELPGHEDDHEGLDPHIWMGPRHALGMAGNMRDALIAARPDEAELFRANYEDLAASVDALDAEIRSMLEPLAGRPLMAVHPSFGYFAAEYGLRQIAVEVDGKDPSPRQIEAIIETAREEGVRVILVQPQFPEDSAAVLADAIGGIAVGADPLAADWEDGIRRLAVAVKDGLR